MCLSIYLSIYLSISVRYPSSGEGQRTVRISMALPAGAALVLKKTSCRSFGSIALGVVLALRGTEPAGAERVPLRGCK